MQKMALILFFFPLIAGAFGQEFRPRHPEKVRQCLENPKTSGLIFLHANNPYYLRGDFDGDSKPDYALEVLSSKGRTGIIICAGNGSISLLGAGMSGKQFSDMADDAFLGLQWQIYTKEQLDELSNFKGKKVPNPIPPAKGETIVLFYDDEIALIYWDGTEYKWAR